MQRCLLVALATLSFGCGKQAPEAATEGEATKPAKVEPATVEPSTEPEAEPKPKEQPASASKLPLPLPGLPTEPLPPHAVVRLKTTVSSADGDEGRGPVTDLAWSGDSAMIATVALDGALTIWDAQTWAELRTIEGPAGDRQRRVALNRDGTRLISNHERAIWVHDATTGAEVAQMEHEGQTSAVAVSADGQGLASAGVDGVRIWAAEGEARHRVEQGAKQARSLAYSPDGARLASGWDDGKVRTIAVETGRVESTFRVGARAERLVFAGGGGRLAAHTGAKGSAVFELATGKTIAKLAFTMPLALDSGGNLLLAAGPVEGGKDATAFYLVDILAGEPVREYAGQQGAIHTARFSPNNLIFATASDDGSVLIWNLP